MPDKVKIYTKSGDLGETSLCNGSRTSKDAARVDAYGDIDELNTFIGLAISKIDQDDIKEHLLDIQKDLFVIGSNLAYPADLSQSIIKGGESIAEKIPRMSDENIIKLERWIDAYDKELPKLNHFILSGGNEASSILHVARTVCRRAERHVVKLKKSEEVNKNVLKYINRLSDYLFTAARLTSSRAGKPDIMWLPD